MEASREVRRLIVSLVRIWVRALQVWLFAASLQDVVILCDRLMISKH